MVPYHLSVGSHAVVATHIEELEGLTIRIYNHALGLWGRKKKEEDWQRMLAQAESCPSEKNKTQNKIWSKNPSQGKCLSSRSIPFIYLKHFVIHLIQELPHQFQKYFHKYVIFKII